MSIPLKDLDPAFQGTSQKPGLQVWRIEKSHVVLVPAAEHGKFYSGNAYIVLKTIALKAGGSASSVHYWIGKSSNQDEAALAAVKAVDLDIALGGKTVQNRESQGHESDLFLSYFRPCVLAMPGSAEEGAGKGGAAGEPRLFQIRGRRFIHVRQVPFARSSLTHSDIFLLDTGSKLFQFNGANCSKQERSKAIEVTQKVMDEDHGGSAPVAIIEDGKLDDPDSNEFWNLFGGFAPIAKKGSSEDDAELKTTPAKLLWVTSDGYSEVSQSPPKLKKQALEGNKCYLVDTGGEVFAWFGRISSLEERRAACVGAEVLITSNNRPPHTKVTRVNERFETPPFKASFDWPMAPAMGDGGGKFKASFKPAGAADKSGAAKEANFPPLTDVIGDIKAWRLSGNSRTAVPPEEVGRFYSSDCYSVLYTYTHDRKHEYLLFFWAGKDSSQEERAAALPSAIKQGDALRGHVTLVRVVQGKEPEQFLSLFKGNLFFFKGKDGTFDPAGVALFHVKPKGTGKILATQVNLVSRSLNSAEAFLLQTPAHPFVWVGNGSSDEDKKAAETAAEILKPGVAVKHLVEAKETSVFWTHLGGKGDYPKQKEAKEQQKDPRLFQVLAASPSLKTQEIPNFVQEDLISEDVLLLDTHTEIFVWLGTAVPDADKKEALETAQKFLAGVAASEGRSKDITLIKVTEGFEPPMFTAHFDWDPLKTAAFMDPYERKLAHLQGRTVEPSDAAKRRFGIGAHSPATDTSVAAETAASPIAVETAAAEAAAAAAAAPTPPSPSSVSSQRAAAIAALSGSIKGVAPKPSVTVAATPEPAAPASPAAAEAPQPSPRSAAASQRAAAIAALSGSLTAEKKKAVFSPSAVAAKVESSPPAAPPPTPAPSAAEVEVSDDSATAESSAESAVTSGGGESYPLERLTTKSADPAPGIDITKREMYLSDSDFESLFGTTKDKFASQPKWKQDQKKRSLDLY